MIYDFIEPASEMNIIRYRFLEPVNIKIKDKNNNINYVSFGIGEFIDVLEPRTYSLTPCYKLRKQIPLADGNFIIDYSPVMRYEYAGVVKEKNFD